MKSTRQLKDNNMVQIAAEKDEKIGVYGVKLEALRKQGGTVVRNAQILRMKDGKEVCLDSYGRCIWITDPSKPEYTDKAKQVNQAAAAGEHYMRYNIAASDVGERFDREFVISRLNLEGFAADIFNRIAKVVDDEIDYLISPKDVGLPLDPFFIQRHMYFNIFEFTLIKKGIRFGSGKAGAGQDLAEMISTCTRAKLEYRDLSWQNFYSNIEAVYQGEIERLNAKQQSEIIWTSAANTLPSCKKAVLVNILGTVQTAKLSMKVGERMLWNFQGSDTSLPVEDWHKWAHLKGSR